MSEHICIRCRKRDIDAELEEALKPHLPDGVKLYDFGGGITIAPRPDLKNGGYLVGSMMALTWMVSGKLRFQVFSVPQWNSSRNDYVSTIVRAVKDAVWAQKLSVAMENQF